MAEEPDPHGPSPGRLSRYQGIELRLVVLVCALVLFTAGVLSTAGLLSYREALLGQQLREMETLAGAAEARLSQLARSLDVQVAALAREDDLREALRATLFGEAPAGRAAVLAELHDLAGMDPALVSVQLYDVSGLAIAGYVRDADGLRAATVDYAFPDSPAALDLARRMDQDESRVIGPFVQPTAGRAALLRLHAGAPVFDREGIRIGALLVEYDLAAALDEIRADARRQLAPLGAGLAIIDADGQGVGDPLALDAGRLDRAMRGLLAQGARRNASRLLEDAGQRFGVAAAALHHASADPGRFGYVALAAPRAHLLAQVREAQLGSLVAAAGFTIFALVVGMVFARRLLKPLDQLLGAVQRFGAGDAVGELPTGRRDEFGRLARAFRDMARQVDERSRALAAEIAERERTEVELRQQALELETSEARYRQLYESITVGVCIMAASGEIRSANPAYAALLGYSSEEALRAARSVRDLWAGPGDMDAYLRRVRQEGELTGVEVRLRRSDGRIVWALENMRALWGADGEVIAYESIVVDITERKQAEYARQASELRFRRLSDSNLIGVAFGNLAAGEISEANSYVLRMLGCGEGELPLSLRQLLGESTTEVVDRVEASRSLRQAVPPLEMTLRGVDGRQVPALLNVALVDPHRDDFVAVIVDRSAEFENLRQLSSLKEFFRLLLDASPMRIAYVDAAERVVFFNEPYLRWYGISADAVHGRLLREVIGEAGYGRAEAEIRRVLAGEARRYEAVIERDGRPLHFDTAYVPHRDADGRVLGFISVVHDVTELRELEARLRQAHKLEALGQLTGGIAHDFNNLLSVAIGNLQLLERQLGPGDRGRRPAQAALRAATRGAELTRRLLSFARLQPLQRCAVDVPTQLADMREMISRTLGERIDIRLDVAAGVWPVDTDPAQLESALLNLAINARDAMSGAGTLTLSAANVAIAPGERGPGDEPLPPGDYVALRVTDDGPGMTPEVMARAFEPFFSTKPVGKGSGLGLAMVYGFAKQSGGTARLSSLPGHGTTVELLLRRAESEAVGARPWTTSAGCRGSETLLVVEDDDDVRMTTVGLLTDLGYRVLDARDAQGALAVLDAEPGVALLLTDVVLPGGMRGTELAAEALRRRPALRVLYVTGFADVRNLARQGVLKCEPLWKPLEPQTLATRVREALDQQPDAEAASA